ncbi:MAG TPA: DUF6797 domain-containing protein, partial [Methylomirabilota bacterium]|nr:DUF6797 domain-containing protein [Methylomirabilota bacterium]
MSIGRVDLWVAMVVGTRVVTATAGDVVERSFYSGTIKAQFPERNVTMKGIVVTVGDAEDAYLCYDTDLMRLSLVWRGPFLKFGNGQREIVHPPPAEVAGQPLFGTRPGPGWTLRTDFTDPRPGQQGPLPREWAKYRGLFVHGRQVILSYSVGASSVLELPGFESAEGLNAVTRSFAIGPSPQPLTLLACEQPGGVGTLGATPAGDLAVLGREGQTNMVFAGLVGAPAGAGWEIAGGRLHLKLPAAQTPHTFKLVMAVAPAAEQARFVALLKASAKPTDLAALTHGGAPRWTAPVTTRGSLGTGPGPYVVDTISEALTNPWSARTFFGGFDFFPDGRVALCTFHGDVWIVSGVDDKLEKLTWKRFATGLFQPLGLKVVEGKIYVTGRDQITRLHDLNQDGEADFYENFNNDTVVTDNYHEFCLDLQTDRAGNFYYAKGSPWTPDVRTPHQGTLLKVSQDGSKLEVVATGLRAPNGMAVGPNDEITVSDNQGHWMPASKLNLVRPGGFYGMMPAAHREITLQRGGSNLTVNPSDPRIRAALKMAGWDAAAPVPARYDEPICWLPMSVDNSSGGQVWVTSDRWGPLQNHLLFMSYGRGTLFHVMLDEVDGVWQAAMTRFPLKFQTGLMRGRCSPRDGQIYVCGLRGWQTDGTRDGALYRVRYTGKPVHTLLAWHARKDGVELRFTGELDPAAAGDAANYAIEQWNYIYSGNYGSPDVSVADPKQKR